MLNLFQCSGFQIPCAPTTSPNLEDRPRYDHSRILKALATILVRNHEVVAITALLAPEQVEVFAIGNPGNVAAHDTQSTVPLTYFGVANPRKDCPSATPSSDVGDAKGISVFSSKSGPSPPQDLWDYLWKSRPTVPSSVKPQLWYRDRQAQ